MLTIQLLGGFQLTRNGEPIVGLTKPRGKSLLTYLLLNHATPQERAHLAYTFWPETSDRQARTNLRRELHQLRQTDPLFQTLIQSDGQRVQWQMPADSTLDVTEFTRLLDAATAAMEATAQLEYYQAAIDCYHGEFLPGLYDEWVLAKREALNQAFVQALETVTTLLVDERDYATAITLTQRLLQHDPLYEAGYAQLMELYAFQDDRARALHTYHTCATVLERELGVPPGNEIETLYQRLHQAEEGHTPRAVVPMTETQLVGRKTEWQTLLRTWRQTSKGHAQMLLIEGEAGIGKTRLGEELLDWVNRQGIATTRTRSYAAEGALAYAPVIEWLRSPALQPAIAKLDIPWRTELARLLPELLTEYPDLPHPEPLTERWQRQRLFEALARAITVNGQPKLLLIDDLQWCDQETLEWLRFLLRFASNAPFLVLGTVRTEELADDHPLHALTRELQVDAQLTRIELVGLDRAETVALAQQEQNDEFEPATIEHIYAESEGNPLFVVEMVRSGYFDTSTIVSSDETMSLPPKVYAVIQHRLVQLSSEARTLVGVAATIGRAFRFDFLAAASKQDDAAVVDALDELWRRQVIREQDDNTYDFSHDRIREVVYNELSPMRRQLLHRRIAQALTHLFTDNLSNVSGELAAHYAAAGDLVNALRWYQHAAKVAADLFACREAIVYLKAGLLQLEQIPVYFERDQDKAAMLLDITNNYVVIEGFSTPIVEKLCQQLTTLLPSITDTDLRIRVLFHLRTFHATHCNPQQARDIAQEILTLVQSMEDSSKEQVNAHRQYALACFQLGHFIDASHHLQTSIDLIASVPADEQKLLNDRCINNYKLMALTRWILGYPVQAYTMLRNAIAQPIHMYNPFERNVRYFWASMCNMHFHDVDRVRTSGFEQLCIGEQHDIPLALAGGRYAVGWVNVAQGDIDHGLQQMQEGINGYKVLRHTMSQTHLFGLLAEAQLDTNRYRDAFDTIEEAFAMSDYSGQRSWDAELHRLHGEILLAMGKSETEVEACYQHAIVIADEQSAKMLELRATMSLSRLWARQERREEAHQILQAIYDWFTEGFDTKDLLEAKSLLAQLSDGIS